MSRFFIARPIFAMVCSILITIAGGVSLYTLAIAQYPPIVPPNIQVTAVYPGANAKTLSDTVAQPIEEQVNGVEGMIYMSSTCTNNGFYSLNVTFEVGTDIHTALMLVQTRAQLAMPQLPEIVQKQGVNVQMQSPSILLAVNIISPDGSRDQLYMSNYAQINIFDRLSRVPGVGLVKVLGQRQYSMRAWLDPQKLAALKLTSSDVVDAIKEQNVQVAAGNLGQQPVPAGQTYQLVLNTQGRLTTEKEFGNIIVNVGEKGRLVYLRDVARLELGSQNSDQNCTLNGEPSVCLAVFQLPQANALDTADGVRKTMEELKAKFPVGLDYQIAYDTTPFIQHSVEDVVNTLLIAIGLVAIVVLVFLQNWRSAIIPLIAVPVAIIGTFIAMAGLGFSLNNLSLFGLVLAIGIVVDDAIVVVENVERWLEEGHTPTEAAIKAMNEVTAPIVAVALVLCAVFIPVAFVPGLTGQFYRQFALTIAVSTVISAFNSLTLSPALSALLLRRRDQLKDPLTRSMNFALGWFFLLFNRGFDLTTKWYVFSIGMLLRVSLIVLLVYGGLLVVTYFGFTTAPLGFIPEQDQGYLLVNVELPDAASLQRTSKILAKMDDIARKTPGVQSTLAVAGYSVFFSADSSNWASMWVILDDFSKRRTRETQANAIIKKLNIEYYKEILGAKVAVFGAPPVPGLGQSGGFQMQIEDQTGLGLDALQQVTEAIVEKANQQPGLERVFSSFRADTPQIYLEIDREKAKKIGVSLNDIFNTLNVNLGSLYINEFNEFGRVWQVNIQAEGSYRTDLQDLKLLQVRSKKGTMVPLGSLLQYRNDSGPVFVMRYNDVNSSAINGGPAPGFSSGDALDLMEQIAKDQLPTGMNYEWTNIAYQEVNAGNTGIYIFGLAVILVFLVLAAQYESWGLPFAIILVVPMCLLCSVVGLVWIAHKPVDIFAQIGFVVLVGMAAKNAILIVEFAKQQREAGQDRRNATLEACRLRLRPILMTSFAFIFGVYPLVIATGAGFEMRRSLGTAVFSGMLGVTLFGIFLTPVFYYVVTWFSKKIVGKQD